MPGWEFDARIEPDAVLQQGDLIAFPNASALHSFGLVVTADCDLRQRKHSRLVTLVPIVDIKTLLEHYLLLEICDRQREKLLSLVRNRFDFTGDVNSAAQCEDLRSRVEEKRSLEGWSTVCRAAEVLLGDVDTLTVADFKSIMAAIDVPTSNLKQRIENQIRDKGDVIILPALSAIGVQADIAWVRWIWQVPTREIAMRNSEALGSMGQRIARLMSPYRYRVTQVMGQVFTDIGTPNIARNFESDLKLLIDNTLSNKP